MQTAREFLVKANLAKPSRGKFSAEAKEYLYQAIANGEKFSDWDENGRISVSPKEKTAFTKRDDSPKPRIPIPETERVREETQIVYTHPVHGREVVMDTIKGQPVWAARKIEVPSWLEGYTWTLR